MRRVVAIVACLAVLPAVAAHAAPAARCRHLMVDPEGDTYGHVGGPVPGVPERGADIVGFDFRSDARTLTTVWTVADIDDPMQTAVFGRRIQVDFELSEATFLVELADGSFPEAFLSLVSSEHAADGQGNGAFLLTVVATGLRWEIDPKRNQARVYVPLAELRKHTGGVVPGVPVRPIRAGIYAKHGPTASTSWGNPVDETWDDDRRWRLGDRSCA